MLHKHLTSDVATSVDRFPAVGFIHTRNRVGFRLDTAVIAFAVAGQIVSIVVGAVPRVEGFSELLQNTLTGLTVQSVVLVVGLQLVFEVSVIGIGIGDFTCLIPHFAGVVFSDIPKLAGTPPVPVLVEHLLYLRL
ncbi:MAG: hypothetical protein J07HQW2_03294 [Haloquadratum walsbyi J07HQW2]|uniref:Uncharacterized protein n=1 Tax=Haloquadratum walsbyi J07HQW2 TaxID=1238425 RepID=U1NI00_9EURY|nr:MAG: hypothetical protein J07HQW2_03294 [Haloquadratum walsbyi J07HQW2]